MTTNNFIVIGLLVFLVGCLIYVIFGFGWFGKTPKIGQTWENKNKPLRAHPWETGPGATKYLIVDMKDGWVMLHSSMGNTLHWKIESLREHATKVKK